MGFDATRGLNYAQTVAATQAGGQFAGYRISHNNDGQLFMNAMLGSHACTVSNNATCASGDTPLREALVGESYNNNPGNDWDYAWFLSDNGLSQEVGFIGVWTGSNAADYVMKANEWSSIANANQYSFAGNSGAYSIGWLLYREGIPNAVPEPASLALFGLGLLGAAFVRRRRA